MQSLRTFRIPLLILLLFYVCILKGNGIPHSFFGGSSYLTTGGRIDDVEDSVSACEIYETVIFFSILLIHSYLSVLGCLI